MRKLARFAMVLGFVATVVAWSAAGGRAEDDAQDEVKAQVSGKIVIVGPDGKRQEMDFGDKLPKEMQERIQQHMKHFKLDGKVLPKCDGVVRGKVLMIGPDGKKTEIELGGEEGKCPKAGCQLRVEAVDGKVVIVGPDGKRREFSLGKEKSEKKPAPAQDANDSEAKEPKKGTAGARVLSLGRAIVIGPDGKRREFNLGETPRIDLDLEGVLPEDLELPDGVEKMLREQLKGIQLPQMRLREMRRAGSDVEAELEQLKQQVEKLQKEVEQLKKQQGKGRKQKTAA